MNISSLKQRAGRLSGDYWKTVCIHGAVASGVTLILSVIDVLLGTLIENTGGLGGLGSRAALETLRSILGMAVSLLLPFWQIGILYTSIRVVRQQEFCTPMLKRGFDRLGPVLRYYLLMIAIVLGVSMVSSYASVPFTMGTPMPPALQEYLLTADESVLEGLSVQQLQAYFLRVLIPMLLVFGLLMLYFSYRFRLSSYLLLDDPQVGAREAMSVSGGLTKGYKWRLFLLDLSFWWYYLLQGAVAMLVLLPDILAVAGVAVPLSAPVFYLLMQLVGVAANLGLLRWKGAYVQLTYACAYDQLRTPPQEIMTV